MLGFDATGRFALGQVTAASTTVLTASAAAYTLTGNAATFMVSQHSSVGDFALTGIAATFKIIMPASVASYIVSGNPSWAVTSQRKPLYISGQGYWRGRL
jgi:hypothetical protein